MVMPFAALPAAFAPETSSFWQLTFCGLAFETLAGAVQGGRTGLGPQLAGPYRVGKIVFQNGRRLRSSLKKMGPPDASRAEATDPGATDLPAASRSAVRWVGSRSMMAHDLRSSLVLIEGFIQRLSGPEEVDPERRRRYLAIIRTEGEKLAALLDDFLVGPEAAGESQPEIRPVLLDRELQQICEAHQLRAERQGTTIALKCPPRLAALPGDGKGLQRAFANLLDNALKYSPPGGTIRVRVREKGREVRISFADEGPGIEPGDLPHLFQPYYRGQGQSHIAGSGLGLAMVKAVAAAHGGRVEVKNRRPLGAVFTIILSRRDP